MAITAYSNTWYDRQGYAGYRYAPAPTNYAPAPAYTSALPALAAATVMAPAARTGRAGGTTAVPGPSQQAPWGYGGEYGYNAGFRSPSKY